MPGLLDGIYPTFQPPRGSSLPLLPQFQQAPQGGVPMHAPMMAAPMPQQQQPAAGGLLGGMSPMMMAMMAQRGGGGGLLGGGQTGAQQPQANIMDVLRNRFGLFGGPQLGGYSMPAASFNTGANMVGPGGLLGGGV